MRLDYLKQINLLKDLVSSKEVVDIQKFLHVDFFSVSDGLDKDVIETLNLKL